MQQNETNAVAVEAVEPEVRPVGVTISGRIDDHDVLLRLIKAVDHDNVPMFGIFPLMDVGEVATHIERLQTGKLPFRIADDYRGHSTYENILRVCVQEKLPHVVEYASGSEPSFVAHPGGDAPWISIQGSVDNPTLLYDDVVDLLRLEPEAVKARLDTWTLDVTKAQFVAASAFEVPGNLLDEIRNAYKPVVGRGLL